MKIANVLISDSWGQVTPDSLEKGIGGREGAMIYLSREWAELGHEVTNFVNVEKSSRFKGGKRAGQNSPGYHEYIPLNLTKSILKNFPHDAVIAWECPSLFSDQDLQTNLKICEMQVCHLQPEETEAAERYCDYVATLSNWHKEFMIHDGLDMKDKMLVFPNGVDISRYPKNLVDTKIRNGAIGDDPHFVYSSSPDRGLWQILQAWPYIRQIFPNAQLTVTYGVKNWTSKLKWAHNRQGQQAVDIEEMMKLTGVRDLGKIGQGQLAKLQLEADAWIYPLDSIQATESGCITAVENAAAGNPIITTDCDCMEEEFGPVGVIAELPFDPKGFAECVEYVLTRPEIVSNLRKDGREFAEGRDWSIIAQQWNDFFQENI